MNFSEKCLKSVHQYSGNTVVLKISFFNLQLDIYIKQFDLCFLHPFFWQNIHFLVWTTQKWWEKKNFEQIVTTTTASPHSIKVKENIRGIELIKYHKRVHPPFFPSPPHFHRYTHIITKRWISAENRWQYFPDFSIQHSTVMTSNSF